MIAIDWSAESARCVALLQALLRIRTINRGTGEDGDGNERPAAEAIAEFLREGGVEPALLEPRKGRTSVIARVKGNGKKAPILLNAHLDVVEADASRWQHDPFGGEIHDGYLWGRGAIDMKHMAAMSACVLRAVREQIGEGVLDRDVIFAGVADEEAGCDLGSLWLVDHHPERIRAEYTLGEIGAFSMHLFGRTFYPIQTAEKGSAWLRMSTTGDPGHGSMPNPDSAVIRLAEAISKLGAARLPMHPTVAVRNFVQGLARELPSPQRQVLGRLTTPQVAGLILDYLIRDEAQRRTFSALLSNTVSPTVVRAGNKTNVIPGYAQVELDGRTLPGQTAASLIAELRAVVGDGPAIEILREAPPTETSAATPLFAHLASTLREHDPLGVPVPFIIPGFTDAKAYSKLGSKCYGFSPVKFDPTHDLSFSRMFHGHDERVPVAGVGWGLRVLFEAVTRFRG
jgi:hypothetical protein